MHSTTTTTSRTTAAMAPILALLLVAAAPLDAAPTGLESPLELAAGEAVITLLGTNDVHGGLEPSVKKGARLGGYEWFAGYASAVRAHMNRVYGHKGQVILLDAGDAAQGTLLSNFSEGMLVVSLMNEVGFSAAVAGNHGFDFGPVGWQQDIVAPGDPDGDPLGALKQTIRAASFPFLGANVTTAAGKPLAELPPYVLLDAYGKRRVAIIGLENPMTPVTTVPENVEGLKFGKGADELKKTVEALLESGKADVFVLIMHEGDGASNSMASFLKSLPRRSDGQPLVDAVIAGHSHFVNDMSAAGIPYVQSSSGGRQFGLIQLVVKKDPRSGRLAVQRKRTRQKAGIPVVPNKGTFLGEPVEADAKVARVLAEARKQVAGIAGRELCTLSGELPSEGGRLQDSAAGNMVADMMRRAAKTEIAVINSGDIRSGLPSGQINYEHLFSAVPKNIRLITVPRLPVDLLVKNLERSVRSCGRRGALQVSGLVVEFSRDCSSPSGGEDRDARLLKLTTTDGQILYEKKGNGRDIVSDRPISMATTDFLMSGGAGYGHFKGVPARNETLALREAVADAMAAERKLESRQFAPGRYRNRSEN
jgi:2',3'-cyclic-nucleotide 2'-phosphodiesterase/3'-nucleotidase